MPTFSTAGRLFGAYTIDRTIFRPLLQDARWLVHAAGWVDPMDANVATISLVYEDDAKAQTTLGSITQSGAGIIKRSLGPFDLFATAGVPQGENIPVIRLKAQKDAGVDGELEAWVIWVRLLPRSV